MNALLAEIASSHLHIETLETRNSDSLDFHDLSVGGVRAALEAAFLAGQQSAAAAREATLEFARAQVDENVLQTASTAMLSRAAAGQLDLNLLARFELANRGMDVAGKWIGFQAAAKLHGVA
jgi:hypothetical protein